MVRLHCQQRSLRIPLLQPVSHVDQACALRGLYAQQSYLIQSHFDIPSDVLPSANNVNAVVGQPRTLSRAMPRYRRFKKDTYNVSRIEERLQSSGGASLSYPSLATHFVIIIKSAIHTAVSLFRMFEIPVNHDTIIKCIIVLVPDLENG
ncbi:hypothetical protein CSUB01_11266 [Colletotrichum sublineola]|uniref:Uncharacterized protein n=1 Tax=Colletotrichum sublineola TaxID=1173701 RepID=A0A066XG84_COLSU|nr:hypothetical protein CSUB01_11266 [Colletotrichum sublineola]